MVYHLSLLPSHVGDVSSYRMRNAENYVGIHANTRAYAESFLPSTLQAWNNPPGAVRSADTLDSLIVLIVSSVMLGFSQLSEKTRTSQASASVRIMSIFVTMLCMFIWKIHK